MIKTAVCAALFIAARLDHSAIAEPAPLVVVQTLGDSTIFESEDALVDEPGHIEALTGFRIGRTPDERSLELGWSEVKVVAMPKVVISFAYDGLQLNKSNGEPTRRTSGNLQLGAKYQILDLGRWAIAVKVSVMVNSDGAVREDPTSAGPIVVPRLEATHRLNADSAVHTNVGLSFGPHGQSDVLTSVEFAHRPGERWVLYVDADAAHALYNRNHSVVAAIGARYGLSEALDVTCGAGQSIAATRAYNAGTFVVCDLRLQRN